MLQPLKRGCRRNLPNSVWTRRSPTSVEDETSINFLDCSHSTSFDILRYSQTTVLGCIWIYSIHSHKLHVSFPPFFPRRSTWEAFWNEQKSQQEAEALRKMVKNLQAGGSCRQTFTRFSVYAGTLFFCLRNFCVKRRRNVNGCWKKGGREGRDMVRIVVNFLKKNLFR